MATDIFTYGSLMFAPVWQQVVGTAYPSSRAYVYGYRRVCVRNASYPAVIKADNQRHPVTGLLYRGLSDTDVASLDQFEGDEYTRIVVPVYLDDKARTLVNGCIYLYNEAYADALLDTDWDPQIFAASLETHLDELMKRLW